MAPFTISTHHPLPYQGRLPQETVLIRSKMNPERSSGKPEAHGDPSLIRDLKTSVMRLKPHLWQVIRRLANCCVKVTELIGSKVFFFIRVARNMTMMGALKRSGVEGLERPGWEDSDSDPEEPEMKVMMEVHDGQWESSMIDSDEEEDECESDEETDEDDDDDEEEEDEEEPADSDSDWSDEDEGDSETSAESLELWESFLNSDDPYNPLSFCSSTGFRTNANQNQLTNRTVRLNKTQPAPDAQPEETHPKADSKEKGKKVCFSDKVTVRPLVAWRFASRAARDGSCWLQMARDRERFRRRVENIETVLKPCLMPEHRAGVWETLQRETSS